MPYIACGIISLRGASILGTVVAEMPAKAVQKLLGHSSGRLGHLFSRGDARVELAAAESAMFV